MTKINPRWIDDEPRCNLDCPAFKACPNLHGGCITWYKQEGKRLEAVEAAARTFVEYDGANDELDYLHYGEYFDALKDALKEVGK